MFKAAKVYEIAELPEICFMSTIAELAHDNVIEVVQFAALCDLNELLQLCCGLIQMTLYTILHLWDVDTILIPAFPLNFNLQLATARKDLERIYRTRLQGEDQGRNHQLKLKRKFQNLNEHFRFKLLSTFELRAFDSPFSNTASVVK